MSYNIFLKRISISKKLSTGLTTVFLLQTPREMYFVNPAYTKNTEILPEEVLGHNIFQLIVDKSFTPGRRS